MAEVKWIRLSVDMFDNRKIKYLRSLPDGNNLILIWVMLLTIAGRCNAGGMIFLTENVPYTINMLAGELNFEESTITLAISALQSLGMLSYVSEKLIINGWEKHQNADGLEKIREQNRIRQSRYKDKQKLITDNVISNVTSNEEVTHGNAIEIDKEIDKDKDNINNVQSDDSTKSVSKKDIDHFFEDAWKLYPNKKGKGQISDAKKKELYNVGVEHLERAIERYKEELKKDEEWRKPQNGSTFFNSGYIDYLDDNYIPSTKQQKQSTSKSNKFNQFPQREYSEEQSKTIEQKLLERSIGYGS